MHKTNNTINQWSIQMYNHWQQKFCWSYPTTWITEHANYLTKLAMILHCARKNVPNIIDRHLKKKYTFLIIFGKTISGTTGHQMTIHYSTSPNVCFCTTWENKINEIWVEMNGNMSKSISNIINCDLKKNWQILIIFGANIFDTTCHQMTVLIPTSPAVCFCTTWENPKRRNKIKMQYFVD